ncbi:MAG TPA: hypothetical protein VF528_06045 [Pyrinomonadaceae bacterium]|jgi:hypothetical protein
MKELQLSRRTLHHWLWDEFDVKFSQVLWEEMENNLRLLNTDRRWFRRNGGRSVYQLPAIDTWERALFSPPLYRKVETSRCRRCGQVGWTKQAFTPDLNEREDRGERHNCCIALAALASRRHKQVIFLTDDSRGIRDYADYVFNTFPLGQIWSSMDFVTYLFLRHRGRILLEEVKGVLRDINLIGVSNASPEETLKRTRRLADYYSKVDTINTVLSQCHGGN